MRSIGSLILMVVLTLGFNSCFDAPHYPATPEIEFNSITFRKGVKTDPLVTPSDSLIIDVNFKDGDGDLGLGTDETDAPYNDKDYFLTDWTPIYFPAGTDIASVVRDPQYKGAFVNYALKRTVPGYDTIHSFVTPYSCSNWDVIKDDSVDKAVDTLYFVSNPNHYNIFVDFYIQQNDQSWKKYDWASEFEYPNCQINGFNGRFPVLSKDLSQSAAQEGKIRYSMRSVAFLFIFSIKNLRLDITIQDRKLHKSNTITTPPFTLQSILK